MRRGTRIAIAVAAAATMALTAGGSAMAANKPTPLQIAQGYMKMPTKITQKIPLRTKPPKAKKLVFLTSGTSQQEAIFTNMKQVGDLVGWQLSELPFTASNGSSIESSISTALSQGANIIVAPALELTLVSESLKQRLLAANVPVIVGQACPSIPIVKPFYPGIVMCQQMAPDAIALANWIAADNKGANTTVLLESMPQFAITIAFRDAFRKELAKACPTCTLVVQEVTFNDYLQNKIPGVLVNRIRANSDIDYLMFDIGINQKGILPALDAANLLGKVKIGGRGIDALAQAALVAGQEDAWTTVPFGSEGYAYMDSVFRIVTRSAGNALNAIQPMQLLTNVNVKSVPDPYLYAPANALQQFRKLWKI